MQSCAADFNSKLLLRWLLSFCQLLMQLLREYWTFSQQHGCIDLKLVLFRDG
jgi:hypothetical protein